MSSEREGYIAAIPKHIFYENGEHPIDAPNGKCICNVKFGSIKIDFWNGNIYAWIKNGVLLLGVCNREFDGDENKRNPDIHVQRLVIEAIVPAFLYQGCEVNAVKGSWEGWGVNFDQYCKARSEGKGQVKAAKTTWTYNKIAMPLGFTRVWWVKEYQQKPEVTVKFVKPRSRF